MKKITSSIFLLGSLLLFAFLYYYDSSVDYYTSELIAYIFWWLSGLFILSLFAVFVKSDAYKIWVVLSFPIAILSIIFAYINRRGSGAILSYDGELITFILIGLYSFISLVYFRVQYLKQKGSKQ
jgi:hypothetical protein